MHGAGSAMVALRSPAVVIPLYGCNCVAVLTPNFFYYIPRKRCSQKEKTRKLVVKKQFKKRFDNIPNNDDSSDSFFELVWIERCILDN